jgi:serine/threonine protein kinase
MWAHISAPCKDLIRGLLTVDPRKRLTAEQVQEHMFFLCVHVSAAIPARSKEAAE